MSVGVGDRCRKDCEFSSHEKREVAVVVGHFSWEVDDERAKGPSFNRL